MATVAIAKRKKKVTKMRKRNPKGSTLMPVLIVGGVVVLGYWYVTNYGPGGAVTKDATGKNLTPSWWDTWFGPTAVAAAPGQPTVTSQSSQPPAPPAGTNTGAGGTSSSNPTVSSTAQSFIANAGTLTLNNFNALSAADRASVTAYFNANPTQVPSSFTDGSFLAYGLGLGGKTSAVINGKQYVLSGGVPNVPTAVWSISTGGGGTSQSAQTQGPSASPITTYAAASDATYKAATSAGSDPNNLNMDQWGYYYSHAVGPIDPSSGDAMINGAISSGAIADRSQPVPLATFIQLLRQYGNVGLSGMGGVVPVALTRGLYSGRGRKGYLN